MLVKHQGSSKKGIGKLTTHFGDNNNSVSNNDSTFNSSSRSGATNFAAVTISEQQMINGAQLLKERLEVINKNNEEMQKQLEEMER